jgi:hypothetical protein
MMGKVDRKRKRTDQGQINIVCRIRSGRIVLAVIVVVVVAHEYRNIITNSLRD